MPSLAVTGSAGFIGSNAGAYFASRGWRVIGLDNFSRAGAEENAHWLQGHGVQVERVDLREADATLGFFAAHEFDAVLHCAAQVAVTTSLRDPRRDFEDNLLGTFNLLEAIRQSGRRPRLIYTSTNKVYGGMEDLMVELHGDRYRYRDMANGISEERPLDFHSPYGCSKGGADQYVRDYSRIYNLPTLVFRQSCIYGERQFGVEDQGWVAWFTIASVLQRPLTIYGDGRQVRDVLYIQDLVRAFELGFESSLSGEIFNVGGGPNNQLSLLELIGQLEMLMGRKLPLSFADWRPGDQRVFVCDVRKIERLLGWRPQTNSQNGVRALHTWVAANRALFKLAA